MTISALVELLRDRRVVVLTGAGCSTESGIPDYRSPGARPRSPIQHRAFVTDAAVRRRYWARAFFGWPRFSAARPNQAHLALASLEREGRITSLITQNVDRLHHAAGSRRVIELHGALADARCLGCGARELRDAVQARMALENPGIAERIEIAPDGDAEVPDAIVARFVAPCCVACGGALKPDVVLFGDNVPRPRVDEAFALLDEAEVLFVIGSSLAVFSGYRFVLRAEERGMPIAILNAGETRGDRHAAVRLHARAGEALPALARALA